MQHIYFEHPGSVSFKDGSVLDEMVRYSQKLLGFGVLPFQSAFPDTPVGSRRILSGNQFSSQFQCSGQFSLRSWPDQYGQSSDMCHPFLLLLFLAFAFCKIVEFIKVGHGFPKQIGGRCRHRVLFEQVHRPFRRCMRAIFCLHFLSLLQLTQ